MIWRRKLKLIAKLLAASALTSILLSSLKGWKHVIHWKQWYCNWGEESTFFFQYPNATECKLQTIMSVFCNSYRVFSLLGVPIESLKAVSQVQLLHLLGTENDAEIIYLADVIRAQWLLSPKYIQTPQSVFFPFPLLHFLRDLLFRCGPAP